jgi:hypothetical protein
MPMRAAGYEPMNPFRRDVAERWIASGDPRKILRALLRLSLNGPHYELAEQQALEFATHRDVWVRRNAATSLGYVARFHGTFDVDRMATLVLLLDDAEVFGEADDALDDVEMFMRVNRRDNLTDSNTAV